MDAFFVLLICLNILIAIIVAIVSLWIIIPKGFVFWLRWKKDPNPRFFAISIFCFFIGLLLLLLLGIWTTQKIEELNHYSLPNYLNLIIFIITSYFLLYLTLPKTIIHYQKWYARKKNSHLALSLFFAFISLFFMNYLFRMFLPIFIK